MSFLTGPTSPKENPNTHYVILHWGLLHRLTMKVVPQGLDTIKTSREGVGGTTTYNDNINHNIFQSYEYINTNAHKFPYL